MVFTQHLKERMEKRNFNSQDIINVLEYGKLAKKPEWIEKWQEYHYTIEGCDIEEEELNIVISISMNDQMIFLITGF